MHRVLGRVHSVASVGVEEQEIAVDPVVPVGPGQDAGGQDHPHNPRRCHRGAQLPPTPPDPKETEKQNRHPRQNGLPEQRCHPQTQTERDSEGQ